MLDYRQSLTLRFMLFLVGLVVLSSCGEKSSLLPTPESPPVYIDVSVDPPEPTAGSPTWINLTVFSYVPMRNVEFIDEEGNALKPSPYALTKEAQQAYGQAYGKTNKSGMGSYGILWYFSILRKEPGVFTFRIKGTNEQGESAEKTLTITYKTPPSPLSLSSEVRAKILTNEGSEQVIVETSSRPVPELPPAVFPSRGRPGDVGILTYPINFFNWTVTAQGLERWYRTTGPSASNLPYTSRQQETDNQAVTFVFSSFPLGSGTYYCDRYKVVCVAPVDWGETNLWRVETAVHQEVTPPGTNLSNPNYESSDVPWMNGSGPMGPYTMYTYAYWIEYSLSGQAINKWYPSNPNDMRFSYSFFDATLYKWQSGIQSGSTYAPLNGTPIYINYSITLAQHSGGTIGAGSTTATVSDDNNNVDTMIHSKVETSTGVSGQIKAEFVGFP